MSKSTINVGNSERLDGWMNEWDERSTNIQKEREKIDMKMEWNNKFVGINSTVCLCVCAMAPIRA